MRLWKLTDENEIHFLPLSQCEQVGEELALLKACSISSLGMQIVLFSLETSKNKNVEKTQIIKVQHDARHF